MLNYNSPIKNQINYNDDLSIKEVSPIMKLNLRGKKREFFTAVGKHLDMILPTEANTSSSSSKLTSIWLSPDEWMVVSNELIEKRYK
jgi:sarcosine oxidase subunit gamma